MMRRLISGNVCGGTDWTNPAGFLIATQQFAMAYRDKNRNGK
jgi:hypothetical protein